MKKELVISVIEKESGLVDEMELKNLIESEDPSGGTTVPCSIVSTIIGSFGALTVAVCPSSACTSSGYCK